MSRKKNEETSPEEVVEVSKEKKEETSRPPRRQ